MYVLCNRRGHTLGQVIYFPGDTVVGYTIQGWNPWDSQSFLQHNQQALHYRIKKHIDPLYCRVIFGSFDKAPGLVIDRYGSVWVAWAYSHCWISIIQQHAKAYMEHFTITCLIIKNKNLDQSIIYGELPHDIPVWEHKRLAYADPLHGQKTGWFYDQRANRQALQQCTVRGHWVDICCYHGGFGLAAAAFGAEHVTFVDRSASALSYVKKALGHEDHTTNYQYVVGDAIDFMDRCMSDRTVFDGVMCDPPCFHKGKKIRNDTKYAYKKWMLKCLLLCKQDGIIVFSSCTSSVTMEHLCTWMDEVLQEACRHGRIIYRGHADNDHGIAKDAKEMNYLSCIIIQCYTQDDP